MLLRLLMLALGTIVLLLFLIATYRKPKMLVYIQIWYIMYIKLFISMGLPDFFNYFTDIITVWLLCCTILKGKATGRNLRKCIPTLKYVLAFFLFSLIGEIINGGTTPMLFLWSMRNYYRFYVFWFCSICWFSVKDVDSVMRFFVRTLYVGAVMCAIQYFVLGYRGDYLGGNFGTQAGCNGYMSIFLCIVIAHVMVQYLQKKRKLPSVIAVLSICSGIAALAELKFFFVEAVVILALCVLFCKSSFRKAMLSSAGIVALVLGVQVMLIIFPSWRNFFTLEGFLGNASHSYGIGESSLSRTTAIPVLAQQFFVHSSQWLFGIGMGNAEISITVPAFMSDLGARYDAALHYSWFSYAMLYLEGGALGLGAYVAFFASCGKKAYDVLRARSMSQQAIVSLIIAFLCPLLIVYNSALRSESGYLIFFMLTMPYIGRNTYTPNRMRVTAI